MGQEFDYKAFTQQDFERFRKALAGETELLTQWFAEERFECDHQVGGFEVEAWLVGNDAMPVAKNPEFLALVDDPEVVPELSLFNVELNVEPRILNGQALSGFAQSLRGTWDKCRAHAASKDWDLMSIGVHPGLKDQQLTLNNMSKSDRYRALNEQILHMRNGRPITLDILGGDHLHSEHSDVMLEAAATSFQIHLQIPQAQAVRAFNCAQILSAPLVALSANAPFVFGRSLWQETRVPVFEQAVNLGAASPQRVAFGDAYLHESLLECFIDNQKNFPILIPAWLDEPVQELAHLRLHNGSIWRWNRPLIGFNRNGSPHLRIENRVVASGPTVDDMIANAAFYWGLINALMLQASDPAEQLDFAEAKANFYRACKVGLEAELDWLDGQRYGCTQLVLDKLLPLAEQGLNALKLEPEDISYYLAIIQQRVRSGRNGAAWQREWVNCNGKDLQGLSAAYLTRQNSQKPVHEWEV